MTDGFHFKPRAAVPDTPVDNLNLRLHNAIAGAIAREYAFAAAGGEIPLAQISQTIAAALIGVLANHLAQSLKPHALEGKLAEVTDAITEGARHISRIVALGDAPVPPAEERKVH